MTPNALRGALVALVFTAATGLAPAAPPPPPGHGASAPAVQGRKAPNKAAPAAPVKLVDINSASRTELKTLPGVGDAEAARIIANRPYLSKAELVTKKVLPTGPYLSLKSRVVAMQKAMPKPKPKP